MKMLNNWWALALRGLVLIILAILIFNHPAGAVLGLAIYFAVTFLVSGGLQLYTGITNKEIDHRGWYIAGGVLDLLLGILLFRNPVMTATVIPIVIGFWAIFAGIVMGVASFDMKKEGAERWWLALLGGALSVIFGFLIVRNPLQGAVTITTLIGIQVLILGIFAILLAFQVRRFRNRAKAGIENLKANLANPGA